MRRPNEAEIAAVAAAMWNDGCDVDGRPLWIELDSVADKEIIREFKSQARTALAAFIRMRDA